MTKKVSDADKVVGVYHQLVELYTQWQSDRSMMNRRWQEFMKTDKAFHQAVENLEAITPEVKKALSSSLNELSGTVPKIKSSVDKAINRLEKVTPNVVTSLNKAIKNSFETSQDNVVKAIKTQLNQELTDGVDRLKYSIDSANRSVEHVVVQSKRQFRWALWKTGIIAILSSLASSFVLCVWLTYSWIPAKIKPISYTDEFAMEEGLNLLGYYNFLTTKEKNMLEKWEQKGRLNRRGEYYPKKEQTKRGLAEEPAKNGISAFSETIVFDKVKLFIKPCHFRLVFILKNLSQKYFLIKEPFHEF